MYLHDLIPARLNRKARFAQIPAAMVEDVCKAFLLKLNDLLADWLDPNQVVNGDWRPIAEILYRDEKLAAVPVAIIEVICAATFEKLKMLLHRGFDVESLFSDGWRECTDCDAIQRKHDLRCPKDVCNACFLRTVPTVPLPARRALLTDRAYRTSVIMQLKRALTK